MSRVKPIFFDIETVPVGGPLVQQRVVGYARELNNDPQQFDPMEAWRRAGINGAFNRVITFGAAVGDGPIEYSEMGFGVDPFAYNSREANDAEFAMLERFADLIEPIKAPSYTAPLVGWNISKFDLKVLWQRSVAVGSRLANLIPSPDTAPWQMKGVVDLALMWNGVAGVKARQYDLALALNIIPQELVAGDEDRGIPPSGDGGEVYNWVTAGNWDRVRHHQKSDIVVTRAVYRKIAMKMSSHEVRRMAEKEWLEVAGAGGWIRE